MHNNYLCTLPLILIVREVFLVFLCGKNIQSAISRGFPKGAQDFFDPPNSPEPSQGQFWDQKNRGLSKNLEKSTIMCFASKQK